VFSEPENEDSYAVVERPELTASAVKKYLQLVDVFEVDHLMNKCLKFKHKMEDVMASYREVYEDMQKQQSNRRSPLAVFCLPLRHALCHSITLTTSARNTNMIPVNTDTNVFVPINHLFTYYQV
jgi:hypothetical protein